MKNFITLLLFVCFFATTASSQVVYNLVPSSTTADNGSTVTVDLTVENFVDMIGFQFEVDWNENVLQFQDITTHGNIMCNFGGNPTVCYNYPGDFGPASITNYFVSNYLDPDFNNPTPNTLQDGDALLTIEFLVIGSGGQSSDISFDINEDILAINSALEELSYNNGMVTINNGSVTVNGTGCAGAGDVTFTASDESGDTGTTGSVKITVDNFEDVEGFGYTINWNPAIISFDSVGNLNLPGLVNPNPPAVGSFGTSQAGDGNLFVSWDDGGGQTVCDGTVIFEIFYTIIGGGGSSTSVDFTGNVEVIKNSSLVPHIINSGSVTVTGTGNPITGIGFIANSVSGDNGTQVCVPITVSNFDQVVSFQYDITWDENIIAYSTILDGNGQPLSPIGAGNPLGLLNPNPPAVGNFGTTNTSNGVLSVSWDNASGVTLADDTPIYQVCYDVLGVAGESSPIEFGGTIEVADVNGLADFTGVPGTVSVSGTFNGLNVEWDCCQEAQINENVCIDVRVVDGFDNMLSLQYGSTWDPAVLTFTGFAFGNGNPLGLSVGNNLVGNANDANVKFFWFDNLQQGVSIAPGTSLYQVCFDVTSTAGQSTTLDFADLPNATPPFFSEASNTSGTIPFLGNTCTVTSADISALALSEVNTSPSCVGATDGALDITVSGGVTEYTYAWSNGAATEDISDLGAGDYTITVTDCRGMSISQTYTILDPTAIDITATITNVSGAGNDGAIDISVSGGTPPYTTYAWSNGAATEDISGLTTGTYTVTVTDSNGCTGEASFVVDLACMPITVNGTTTDETFAGNDGTITITSSTGGTAPYTYTWSNSLPAGPNQTGLAPGTYAVTATDVSGCTGTASFTIQAYVCPTVTVNGTATDETSAGNDGMITITSSTGGNAPYTYTWSNSLPAGPNQTGLAPGTYTVTATDVSGCTGTASFTIQAFVCPTITVAGSGSHVTCAGGSDGTATATATGGTAPYTYAWSNNANTQNISNLSTGTYTVTATDVDGCAATAMVTVNDGVSVNVSLVATQNLSCFNNNSGSITVSASGGNGTYQYAWSQGGSTSATNSGLAAGVYAVTATDETGCAGVLTGISVSQPDDISITGTVDDVDCNGGNNGSITLNITGGTGAHDVFWSNNDSGQTISNLAAGTYTPTVTDDNGCEKVGPTFTVGEPAVISVTPTINDASCFGEADGSVSLNVSGGTFPYTINWSNTQTGPVASGLEAGNISVTIIDAKGCTFSDIYTIGQPVAITLDFAVTNESTAGSDGAVNLTVTPSGIYTYSWTAANQSAGFPKTTQNINNVIADVYTVVVTDQTGCTAVGMASVTNSLGIQSAIETDVTCFDGNDGKIELTVTGGEPTYGYLWSNGATTQDIFNLTAGNYTVTITDAEGTQLFATYNLSQPSEITITDVFITHEVDDCDGKIDIEVAGGSPPYSFAWSGTSQQIEDPMDLCEGNYKVTITDSKGCFIVSPNYQIEASLPQIGQGNITTTNVSCAGETDGTLTVTIVGGNKPYIVVVTNLTTGQIYGPQNSTASTVGFGALDDGEYVVSVTDGNGNSITSSIVTITEPNPLQITNAIITNQSPNNCNGAINISVAGGTQPYSYQWNNGMNFQDPNMLCMGNYSVTITDAKGCVFESDEYTVGITIGFQQVITNVSCNGELDGAIDLTVNGGVPPFTYVWTDAANNVISNNQDISNQPAGTYTVMIQDAMNTQIFSGGLTIFEPAVLEITNTFTIQPTITDCADGEITIMVAGGTQYQGNPKYDYIWEDEDGNSIDANDNLTDLTGGTYFVTVSDANGCSTVAEISLAGCQIDPAFTKNDITCFGDNDGSITVSALNGTPDFTYSWSNGMTGSTINNLSAGDYTVTITDANGVEGTVTVTIDEPDPIQVTVSTFPGRAEAIVLGGTPPYIYQWNDNISNDPIVEGLKGNNVHALMVTDANGCTTAVTEFRVPYDNDCMTAREVISPNEDSFNDVFYVNCVEDQTVKVTIFNRWGQEVFQSNDYDNSWDGIGKRGELLPEGGYFYVLEFETSNGGIQIIKGSLSIIR